MKLELTNRETQILLYSLMSESGKDGHSEQVRKEIDALIHKIGYQKKEAE